MPTSGGSNVAVSPASSGEGRKISCEDIQLVKNLIEQCLQLYMHQSEVIRTLLNQAKIEPSFTSLVWQKLEEQNPDFFKAYYIRLKLKRQIVLFNHLLEQQAQLMQMCPAEASVPSLQNGMHSSQVHHLPISYPIQHQPPILAVSHPHIVPLPVPSPSLQILSGHHVPDSLSPQESAGHNGIVDMGSEIPLLSTGSSVPSLNTDLGMGPPTVSPGNSNFLFTAIGNPTDMTGLSMDVPTNIPLDAPFAATDKHAQSGLGTLHMTADADTGVGALLGHLPRNFSLSDLTAELTNSSDILGSYSGSPFLTSDADIYICSPDKDCLDDEERLDDVTDPLIYEDFVDLDVDEE